MKQTQITVTTQGIEKKYIVNQTMRELVKMWENNSNVLIYEKDVYVSIQKENVSMIEFRVLDL